MSVETEAELAALKATGAVVAEAIQAMRAHVAPGVSTAELDAVAAAVFDRHGARSGPRLDYDFPGATCISVNDEAIHAIPGPRRLRDRDLVKLDVTAELDGFYADACATVQVGGGESELVDAAEAALTAALGIVRAGMPVSAIGAVVQDEVARRGLAVCDGLNGHGIGRRIHEWPTVPNVYQPWSRDVLSDGLVITIEPIVCSGDGAVALGDDGWTVSTVDGSWVAHAEHTIVVTQGAPIVITEGT
jgi:methionyl aminopeptidase